MSARNLAMLTPRPQVAPETSVWATVTAVSPLRIKIDGESTPLPFTPDTLVANLSVSDRVRVMFASNDDPATRARRTIVVGRSGGQALVIPSSTITTAMLQNDSVDNTKLANMAQSTFKGRAAGAGTGDPTDLSMSQARAAIGINGWVDWSASFTWTASTTNPTKGSSTYYAEYKVVDDICWYQWEVSIGSGFAAGSGNYRFGIPITSAHQGHMGGGLIADASPFTVWNCGLSIFSTDCELYRSVDSGPTQAPFGAASITLAAGDLIRGWVWYKI